MRVPPLILLISVFAVGCQHRIPDKALWNGSLHRTDTKSIPFRVFIDLQSPMPSGYFLVGNDKTTVPEIRRQGDSLTFLFSEYGAAMRGVLNGDEWRGNYILYRNTITAIPFTASAVTSEKSSAPSATKPAIPLVGKFQAFLQQGNKIDSGATGTFWMKNDSIFGTLIAPDGDYGLNVGTQNGNDVTLSRFTGWQAQLFEFRQEGTSWKGTFYVRDHPPTLVTLEPRSTLLETIPGNLETKIKKPRVPFAFSGITSDGQTLTNLSKRFRGKALIIDIMGTWCHNCMDEAPILQQIYTENKDKGLVLVGLSFEITDNPELGKKNIGLYQQKFGITFPILFCGSTEDKYVGPALQSQLDNFYAYPTALFINKKGRVQYIHIGFKGPGTGEEFQAEVKHIYDVVKSLINS